MREVEQLKEAGSRGAGIRVLLGQRAGSSYTSDLTREGIVKMVDAAVSLAKIASEDKFAGMPEPNELGSLASDPRAVRRRHRRHGNRVENSAGPPG